MADIFTRNESISSNGACKLLYIEIINKQTDRKTNTEQHCYCIVLLHMYEYIAFITVLESVLFEGIPRPS